METQLHLCLLGPPAVGKLTVGRLLSEWNGFPLYDNARSIDTAMLLFAYGTEDFREFRDELRFSFYSRAASSNIAGLISTCCLARNSWPYLHRVEAILTANGWNTSYFLLTADEATILSRGRSPDRGQKTALTAPSAISEWLAKNWPPILPQGMNIQQIETTNTTAFGAAMQIKTFRDI